MSTTVQLERQIATLPGYWNREIDDSVHALLDKARELNINYDLLTVRNRKLKGPMSVIECEECHRYTRLSNMGAGYLGYFICKPCTERLEEPFKAEGE